MGWVTMVTGPQVRVCLRSGAQVWTRSIQARPPTRPSEVLRVQGQGPLTFNIRGNPAGQRSNRPDAGTSEDRRGTAQNLHRPRLRVSEPVHQQSNWVNPLVRKS